MWKRIVGAALALGVLSSVAWAGGFPTLLGVGVPPTGAAPPAYTGPGDIVASALAWWGLRAYSAATKGTKAVNVCIPLDATCADLSSDVSTGALVISMIGGSSCSIVTCTVKTIYDQTGSNSCSGSPCDLTQATIANRPVLTVSCVSSLPCMTFTAASSQQLAKAGSIFTQAQPWTLSNVAYQSSAVNGTIAANVTSGAPSGTSFLADSRIQLYAGLAGTTPGVLNTWYAIQGIANAASSIIYLNGSSNTVSSFTNGFASTETFAIGNDGYGDLLDGKVTEVGFWGSGFSGGNQSSMNSNQRAYWGF